MRGTFFIIFIVITVYNVIQRAKQRHGGTNGNNSLPNTTINTPPANNTTKPPVQQTLQNIPVQPMAQSRPTRTASKNNSVQPAAQHKSAQAAIQEAREDGNSTTAYLMEKAEADAREHAKEKYEEQKRLYETRGGLAVADRYLEGDSIPKGKKCINCGYCGAENLIPMMPRTKYSCYFCREPL